VNNKYPRPWSIIYSLINPAYPCKQFQLITQALKSNTLKHNFSRVWTYWPDAGEYTSICHADNITRQNFMQTISHVNIICSQYHYVNNTCSKYHTSI